MIARVRPRRVHRNAAGHDEQPQSLIGREPAGRVCGANSRPASVRSAMMRMVAGDKVIGSRRECAAADRLTGSTYC